MDNNNNQQQQQRDVQEALARALHAGDLARVQAAPPTLLRRSDACIVRACVRTCVCVCVCVCLGGTRIDNL